MYSWDTLFIESCLCCCTVQYGKSAYVNVRSGINRYIMYLRAPPFNRKINLTKDDNYCMDVVWISGLNVATRGCRSPPPPPQTASSQVENRLTSQIVHEFSRETSGGGWKKSRNLKKYIEYNMWRHDNYTSHFPYSHTSHSQHRYFGMQENFQCGFGIFKNIMIMYVW